MSGTVLDVQESLGHGSVALAVAGAPILTRAGWVSTTDDRAFVAAEGATAILHVHHATLGAPKRLSWNALCSARLLHKIDRIAGLHREALARAARQKLERQNTPTVFL